MSGSKAGVDSGKPADPQLEQSSGPADEPSADCEGSEGKLQRSSSW